MAFKRVPQKFTASVNEVTIGTGDKAIVLGGENVMPLYSFDAPIANLRSPIPVSTRPSPASPRSTPAQRPSQTSQSAHPRCPAAISSS